VPPQRLIFFLFGKPVQIVVAQISTNSQYSILHTVCTGHKLIAKERIFKQDSGNGQQWQSSPCQQGRRYRSFPAKNAPQGQRSRLVKAPKEVSAEMAFASDWR
jgi:hypothetical protein